MPLQTLPHHEDPPEPQAESDSEPARGSATPLPRDQRAGALLILAVTALLALALWAVWSLPLSRALQPLAEPTLVFLDSRGDPIARKGALKEAPVRAADLPAYAPLAFVAVEDRRFFSHIGVDPRGMARAFLVNWRAGRVAEGGSTLTQQLAKNAFLDPRRTLKRKVQEALIALWLEMRLSKQEILSRYLSAVYFGDGVYGLRAAARHYFAKPPERLTLAESAMLAGLVNAPSRLSPTRNLAGARRRARRVLDAMVEIGAITRAQADAAKEARPAPAGSRLPSGSWFVDWCEPEARDAVGARYGETEVVTTLDARLQRRAETLTRALLAARGARLGVGQAALVAMRRDGSVLAMVGGGDYGLSQFNRAVQARRQPGSAFKLFVYLAALRAGLTPETPVLDAPLTLGDWTPENADGRYRGPIRALDAFALSSNVAAVRLSEQAGRGAVIRAARDLGVTSPIAPLASLALGSQETTLIEMTSAYAALAAGGYPVRPHALAGTAAQPLRRLDPRREREPLLAMLRAVTTRGTGRAAALPGFPVYGKTGTTTDYRDALFIGFAGDLVVGVWVGNDDHAPMRRIVGGGLPAELFRRFVGYALTVRPDLRQVRDPAAAPLPTRLGLLERLRRALGLDAESESAVRPISYPARARRAPHARSRPAIPAQPSDEEAAEPGIGSLGPPPPDAGPLESAPPEPGSPEPPAPAGSDNVEAPGSAGPPPARPGPQGQA